MDKQTRPASPASSQLRAGLAVLLRSHEYAEDLGCDPWDLAVEISVLHDEGLTQSDLRWLACKGLVQHAREVSLPGEERREFRHSGRLIITRRSSFILTPAGVEFARRLFGNDPPRAAGSGPASSHATAELSTAINGTLPKAGRPHWDADRHELRVGGELVKRYRLPSPNQETVLAAFEEEDWPVRIDDPLPLAPELDPKRRLQDTIKSLNRCQKAKLIRFTGDGTGQGICWELTTDPLAANPTAPQRSARR